jgi:three-Cys-motif partner protein
MAQDSNPNYWLEYTNLQHVKHELIREYLKGWFPKLGFWSGRVVYLDTHAGRGTHVSGHTGSPVVAIDTFLSHAYRDRILQNSEVTFFLIECNAENVEALRREVASRGKLPDRVQVYISCDDCFTQLEALLADLQGKGKTLAPAFVFVDPYGFKVPGDLVRRLIGAGRVEVFINIIWRELDMAIAQAREQSQGGMVDTLSLIFGGERWRNITGNLSFDERADMAVDLLRDLYGAKWATSIRMLGDNRVTRYVLAHFTNHEAGRDLMKDCMWAVCPDGGFYARRSDNPKQTMLIEAKPNLAPLDAWLTQQLKHGPTRWAMLSERIRNELWRPVHLSQLIRKRRREGTIVASEFSDRFSEKANPLLTLVKTKGK